jgi:hypothetical protein
MEESITLIGLHHVRFIDATVFYSFARRGAGHLRDADVIIRSPPGLT